MKLDGAVALVTGGSRGIGKATVLAMAERGTRVAVNYVEHDREAEETLKLVKKKQNESFLVKGDVADIEQSRKVMAKVLEEYGRLDVLINNAAIISWKAMDDERLRRLHRVLDVNVKGMVNMTYGAVKHMKEQEEGGVIVNISSGAGKTAYPNLAVYSASKFAVMGFTQAVAQEVDNDNIRVYAVCPGMTATDMTGGAGMPPDHVAHRIIQTAEESLGLMPGDDTEIYQ